MERPRASRTTFVSNSEIDSALFCKFRPRLGFSSKRKSFSSAFKLSPERVPKVSLKSAAVEWSNFAHPAASSCRSSSVRSVAIRWKRRI